MSEPLLRVESADFGYSRAAPVLREVNLSVRPGEFLVLHGPNASGKTTLIRGLLGLVPQWGGQVTWTIPRERVGYVPQEIGVETAGPATALDMARLSRPFAWHRSRNAALKALERMGLAEAADMAFSELSGGQKRRAVAARALAATPSLLLLDEPTANVDAATMSDLEILLDRLCREENLAVLAVAHAAEWAPMARRIAVENGAVHG
jgi:ABC-type Mn2+/Zn2+ transport system ATPase subunit